MTKVLSDQLMLVFAFTFLIHLINTLSYSVRIVGVRTGRIAASIALFNILVLVARISHAFQAPLLAKKIEQDILFDRLHDAEIDFRILLLAASCGAMIGALFSPTFRNLFTKYVQQFDVQRSVPKLLVHSLSKIGVQTLRETVKPPSPKNIEYFKSKEFPFKLALMNLAAVSILTVGVFASLYAAYTNPDLRTTSATLAPVVTGLATIVLLIFVDPKLSALTDDMLAGKASSSYFYTCVMVMVLSHIGGTILAQVLLVPATQAILLAGKFL